MPDNRASAVESLTDFNLYSSLREAEAIQTFFSQCAYQFSEEDTVLSWQDIAGSTEADNVAIKTPST